MRSASLQNLCHFVRRAQAGQGTEQVEGLTAVSTAYSFVRVVALPDPQIAGDNAGIDVTLHFFGIPFGCF